MRFQPSRIGRNWCQLGGPQSASSSFHLRYGNQFAPAKLPTPDARREFAILITDRLELSRPVLGVSGALSRFVTNSGRSAGVVTSFGTQTRCGRTILTRAVRCNTAKHRKHCKHCRPRNSRPAAPPAPPGPLQHLRGAVRERHLAAATRNSEAPGHFGLTF